MSRDRGRRPKLAATPHTDVGGSSFSEVAPWIEAIQIKPARGMVLAFTPMSSAELADRPARVIDIWPRLPSGDYLVVLEYEEPVRLGKHLITQIGALVSELHVPRGAVGRGRSTLRVGFQRSVGRTA
jgi:hypothetical protein